MKKVNFIVLAMLLFGSIATSQTVETYAGNKRVGVDLMWFKFFSKQNNEKTPFLFFSRNRASTDWDNAPTAFGSTNAVSYNFKNGVGLVAVGSFVNAGFTPKAGVQFVKIKGDFLFFGWLVADLKKEGNLDLFGMFRWQPKLNEQWRLFSQVELFPVYKPENEFWNITQRLRIGAKYHGWAAGFMADFNQSGKGDFAKTNNIGGFLRHDF
ncbi:MAG: hypothetical protein IT258_10125 [Saprospiraceae bacterium]|nr:hypothetical protein [Saprospiraceae bacterium]